MLRIGHTLTHGVSRSENPLRTRANGAPHRLPGSSLPGSSLPGSSLPGSSLPGSSLPGSSLPGSSLPRRILHRSSLIRPVLIRSILIATAAVAWMSLNPESAFADPEPRQRSATVAQPTPNAASRTQRARPTQTVDRQTLRRARRVYTQGQRISLNMTSSLDEARTLGDRRLRRCLDAKLSETNATLRVVERIYGQLEQAVAANDEQRARYLLGVLEVQRRRMVELELGAHRCPSRGQRVREGRVRVRVIRN